jgi:hypothetical protein
MEKNFNFFLMLEQLVQAWCRVPVATAALLLPQQA